jgi:hypothetical protein
MSDDDMLRDYSIQHGWIDEDVVRRLVPIIRANDRIAPVHLDHILSEYHRIKAESGPHGYFIYGAAVALGTTVYELLNSKAEAA